MTIDLEPIKSAQELHQVLKEKLRLPHFYGRNWDAFWDAITGLSTLPAELVLTGFNSFEYRLPKDAAILKRLVAEYNKQGPGRILLQ